MSRRVTGYVNGKPIWSGNEYHGVVTSPGIRGALVVGDGPIPPSAVLKWKGDPALVARTVRAKGKAA